MLSGGGTGGHVFPAIAIADAIKQRYPDAHFLFVGAKGKMEMEKVPAAGYAIKGLWISGFQRRFTLGNILFPIKVLVSLFNALQLLKQFKPDIVIGTGGYASGPLLQMALRKKIPVLIQEQNSFPGVTNRILAKHVNTICVAFAGLEGYFPAEKIKLTGNPVRKDIIDLSHKREQAIDAFGLKPNVPVVLVLGGSLGARTINETIYSHVDFLHASGYQILWQTGQSFITQINDELYELNQKNVVVLPFIQKMDYAYAVADIIVSRAGAISLSEIMTVQKPALLIPSPNVTDDHQTKNALSLQQQGAAIILKDAEANALFARAIQPLLESESLRAEMAMKLKDLAKPHAAESIANEALRLIPQNRLGNVGQHVIHSAVQKNANNEKIEKFEYTT